MADPETERDGAKNSDLTAAAYHLERACGRLALAGAFDLIEPLADLRRTIDARVIRRPKPSRTHE